MNGHEAYEAILAGKCVRLSDWPLGQYLRRHVVDYKGSIEETVAVYRNHQLSHHNHKPSGREFASTQWEICEPFAATPAASTPA